MSSPKALKLLSYRINRKSPSRFISQIKDQKGTQQIGSKKILDVFNKFYSSLYTSKNLNKEDINKF